MIRDKKSIDVSRISVIPFIVTFVKTNIKTDRLVLASVSPRRINNSSLITMNLDENNAAKSIGIIGAGLAGTMVATLLGKLGFNVTIFEKRLDPRIVEDVQNSTEFGNSTSATKRSINLALSHRGICALTEIGLFDIVMKGVIPMPGRIIHMKDGTVQKQAYGKDDQSLYSVSRQLLNKLLLDTFMSTIPSDSQAFGMKFGYSLSTISGNGDCTFVTSSGSVEKYTFDLIIGADGAYSATRDNLLKQGRINFSRQYIAHGYKELTIPPVVNADGTHSYALPDVEGLHIWPRGDFMLIALPNPDKSFTATLFAPYKSEKGGFDTVDPNDRDAVRTYFNQHFPDVIHVMPTLADEYRNNPVGSLVSVRVSPWNFGRTVLLGDAAHAVVPFYGQVKSPLLPSFYFSF